MHWEKQQNPSAKAMMYVGNSKVRLTCPLSSRLKAFLNKYTPVKKNNKIPTLLVKVIISRFLLPESPRIKKSTLIWPFAQDVKGSANPITIAPEKDTNS